MAATPPPVIGKAGNLTVFITPPATPSPAATPRSSRLSESPRPDFSTPTHVKAAPLAEKATLSPSQPPPPVRLPPVQVPPPQFDKAAAAGKPARSVFGFFWDAVARVQEAHASLDEYVANWFGLDQSKYQWALNDYYESNGKDQDDGKAGKPKELSSKVQKV